MRGLLVVGWACGLLLGGCASLLQPATRLDPEGFAHRKVERDVALYWNLAREDGRVTARGYVQSTTPPTVLLRLVYVTLVGYDAAGREVVRSRPVFADPSRLNVEEPPNDQGTFEVAMALGDAPATRFDLEVFYIWFPSSPGPGEPSGR
jgi:hypothetical protein